MSTLFNQEKEHQPTEQTLIKHKVNQLHEYDGEYDIELGIGSGVVL